MINDSKNAHKPRGLGSDSQPPKSWQGGSEIPRSSWPVNESGQINKHAQNASMSFNVHVRRCPKLIHFQDDSVPVMVVVQPSSLDTEVCCT